MPGACTCCIGTGQTSCQQRVPPRIVNGDRLSIPRAQSISPKRSGPTQNRSRSRHGRQVGRGRRRVTQVANAMGDEPFHQNMRPAPWRSCARFGVNPVRVHFPISCAAQTAADTWWAVAVADIAVDTKYPVPHGYRVAARALVGFPVKTTIRAASIEKGRASAGGVMPGWSHAPVTGLRERV